MRLPRNDRSMRRFLAVVALPVAAVLTLSACAAGTPTASGDASSAGADAGNHLVQHARGGTEVPANPQRVVVLEPVQLDTSVALGVIPVGSAVLSEAAGIPKYLGEKAAGIASVGTVTEPSIEKIAALKPDLIIGTETRHSALYDQLRGEGLPAQREGPERCVGAGEAHYLPFNGVSAGEGTSPLKGTLAASDCLILMKKP